MSDTCDALRNHLGMKQHNLDDDVTAGAASAQAGAYAIVSDATRVTVAQASGSLILRNILTNDAPPTCWVLNESGQTIKVYCSLGDLMNGVANSFLSLTDGQGGVFVRVRKNLDWRGAAIP